jgi:Family of unknown function (DUF6325)
MTNIAPVEYMIVSFSGGDRFTGELAPALAELVESNTIRIIDLAFVTKDAEGEIEAFELSELHSDVRDALDSLGIEGSGLLNAEDLAAAGDALEPDSSAALLLWENIWAGELAQALRGAGGEVVMTGRVPHDTVLAAREYVLAAAADTQEADNVPS